MQTESAGGRPSDGVEEVEGFVQADDVVGFARSFWSGLELPGPKPGPFPLPGPIPSPYPRPSPDLIPPGDPRERALDP